MGLKVSVGSANMVFRPNCAHILNAAVQNLEDRYFYYRIKVECDAFEITVDDSSGYVGPYETDMPEYVIKMKDAAIAATPVVVSLWLGEQYPPSNFINSWVDHYITLSGAPCAPTLTIDDLVHDTPPPWHGCLYPPGCPHTTDFRVTNHGDAPTSITYDYDVIIYGQNYGYLATRLSGHVWAHQPLLPGETVSIFPGGYDWMAATFGSPYHMVIELKKGSYPYTLIDQRVFEIKAYD